MKSVLAGAALVLTAAFLSLAVVPQSSAQDLSSARAKQTKKQKPRAKPVRAPQPTLFGWRPADPSFDPQGRLYRPPPGLTCPIDLGYGRWASCNDEY